MAEADWLAAVACAAGAPWDSPRTRPLIAPHMHH